MTAHPARPLRLSLFFILAAFVSLSASAETLIIVPADESGSTAMTKDIAKTVVIPIMKAGKHKVIPYKNYRKAALAGGIEATDLSGEAAMVEHGTKLGATKGVEVKVIRKGSKAGVRVVDLAAKVVVFEKTLAITGNNLTGGEGKSLIAEIYNGLEAKPAPKKEETPAEPAPTAAAVPAEASEAPTSEAAATPAPAPAPAAATPTEEPAQVSTPTNAAPAPAAAEAPKAEAEAPAQKPTAETPAAPELELKLEDSEVATSQTPEAPTETPAVATASVSSSAPQMVTLRAGNKALYLSSAVSDGTTKDLNYATNAFVPGIAVGATLAPAATMENVADWAKHLTVGFTLNPIMVQPQAYSTTGDATVVLNWSLELGYAPRALTTMPELAVGAFANVTSFSMPVGLGGFPDIGLQMLETGVVATYDAGDILTIEDIVKGLKFEATAMLGIGLGVDQSLDVLGDSGMTIGYGASINAQTRVFDFFQVGSELGFSGSSTSFSGASTLSDRREQFNDASLSSSYVTFQLFARKSFL